MRAAGHPAVTGKDSGRTESAHAPAVVPHLAAKPTPNANASGAATAQSGAATAQSGAAAAQSGAATAQSGAATQSGATAQSGAATQSGATAPPSGLAAAQSGPADHGSNADAVSSAPAEPQPNAPPAPGATAPDAKARTDEAETGATDNKPRDKAGETAVAGDKAVVTVKTASGRRVTRVLRHANPVRAARTAGRSTSAWAKRPAGRLIVPAIIAVLLLGAAGTAGAYLVPKALRADATPSATPGFPLEAAAPGLPGPSGSVPLPGGPGGSGLPTVPGVGAPAVPGVPGARPADALEGWAQQAGTRAGIPVIAVESYGYAELVLTRTVPSCHLSWTTIAALASVESAHGSANGAVLGADGSVQPPVYGLPLDGKGGRQLIRDSDQGTFDGDTTFDRAVGPLQFIPSTWLANAVDADNNGLKDPNDIDDASLTAASYLCKNGRDMSKADAWWDAILSYNAVRPYAQKVFDAANEYGQRSRI